MMQDVKYKITSNDFFDILIRYNTDPDVLERYAKYSVHPINEVFAVIYLPVGELSSLILEEFGGYNSVPNYYVLSDEQSLEASGVNQLRRNPATNLRGKGVAIGIIDTGIDYTNPVFLNADGKTRILSIWDQTIDSDVNPIAHNPTYYGTEYTSEQINQALKNPDPFRIVPSTDEIGHGTMLAGIAAGSEDNANNFSGVAPDASLIIVKLKQMKNNLKDIYLIPQDRNCYQENDVIWGLQYVLYTARTQNLPLAICIGLGTSLGAHDNNGLLNLGVEATAEGPKIAISVTAGNEGGLNRHFFSELDPKIGFVDVDLNIGENEYGFTMELWGDPPMIYTMNILTPSGETQVIIAYRLMLTQTIRFIFDPTIIHINFVLVEPITGKQVIIVRFERPSSGIWRFKISGKGDIKGAFHIWLPAGNLISTNTYFLNANPNTTITSPGNCLSSITATAYNATTGTIFTNAGRGFSTSNIINPTLAAPGVNIQAPSLNHSFIRVTGTSAATAHITGLTALLLEWGVVNNNYPNIDTVGIKKFLMRGAKRSSILKYPNPDWGYGIVDIYNAFNIFRTFL